MKSISNQQLAYFLLRIILGINFFGHGLVRLPKIASFRTWMAGEFQNSMLPSFLTSSFATVLPIAEYVIGILLLFGLFTRQVLIVGAMLMIALIFGSCLIEKWEFVGFQMIYALFFFVLVFYFENNVIALDKKQKD